MDELSLERSSLFRGAAVTQLQLTCALLAGKVLVLYMYLSFKAKP